LGRRQQSIICHHLRTALRQHLANRRAHEVLGLRDQNALVGKIDHVYSPLQILLKSLSLVRKL
jgi:hypothetical protein